MWNPIQYNKFLIPPKTLYTHRNLSKRKNPWKSFSVTKNPKLCHESFSSSLKSFSQSRSHKRFSLSHKISRSREPSLILSQSRSFAFYLRFVLSSFGNSVCISPFNRLVHRSYSSHFTSVEKKNRSDITVFTSVGPPMWNVPDLLHQLCLYRTLTDVKCQFRPMLNLLHVVVLLPIKMDLQPLPYNISLN
jgi:hypothetical protein